MLSQGMALLEPKPGADPVLLPGSTVPWSPLRAERLTLFTLLSLCQGAMVATGS